jgi:hypothetical protein
MRSLLMVAAILWGGGAAAAEPVAQIKSLDGTASVKRGEAVLPLAGGADLFADDVVITDKDSRLGLIFRDDTSLSMGPISRLVIDAMVFEPVRNDMALGMTLAGGTFSVHAGQIAKLAPERTVIRTPTATLAIRGTTFLVKVAGHE